MSSGILVKSGERPDRGGSGIHSHAEKVSLLDTLPKTIRLYILARGDKRYSAETLLRLIMQ
jgi:hypothetical protein